MGLKVKTLHLYVKKGGTLKGTTPTPTVSATFYTYRVTKDLDFPSTGTA